MLGDARIVDERVELAPRCSGSDDLFAILIARHVALHDDHIAACAAAKVGGLLGFLLAGRIVDDDTGAFLGEDRSGRGP